MIIHMVTMIGRIMATAIRVLSKHPIAWRVARITYGACRKAVKTAITRIHMHAKVAASCVNRSVNFLYPDTIFAVSGYDMV